MISTLTSAVSSVVVNGTLAGILATIGILLLVALLVLKELSSVAGGRYQKVTRVLNVAIIPLLITFVLIVVSKGVEVIL
jgi:hypothetical protein